MSQETIAQKPEMDQQDDIEQDAITEDLGRKLATCNQKVQDLEERIRYLMADFENYRRNAEKERSQWYLKAQGDVLLDFLTIIDDFERAFSVAHTQIKTQEMPALTSWLEGFALIRDALYKILKKYDVKEMPASGEFDPERHEALQQVPSHEHASGQIVSVIRKGYLYKGMILRPAQVTVAQ